MKAMILSDLITLKRSMMQLTFTCIIIGSVIGAAMGSTVSAAACIASMLPFMFLFSIVAYDELNGWERFRMSLPISRRNVVLGRYASAAIVSGVSLLLGVGCGALVTAVAGILPLPDELAIGLSWEHNPPSAMFGAAAGGVGIIMITMSVALPLIMRYGMTKATRIIPIVFLLIFCFGMGFFGEFFLGATGLEATLVRLMGAGDAGFLVLAAGAIVVVAAIYAISAAISIKLYAKREL